MEKWRVWFVCTAATLLGACAARVADSTPFANPPIVAIPRVGARVRIIVPALGPGWRVGMFQRTRAEPPCYLVLLFSPANDLSAPTSVYASAIVRMQVSTLFNGDSALDRDPGASAYDGEGWTDASVDSAKTTGRTCPSGIERSRH